MSVKQVFNTSAELDYPTVLPTLDLDFANSKTLDPRITFTRASGGTYVGADGLIKYAGVNEARFDHDPVTGESLGLLIEESRVNIHKNNHSGLRGSGTFNGDRFYWDTNSTDEIAPDGSNSTFKVYGDGTETFPAGSMYVVASNGTTYTTTNVHTSSVFIKPALNKRFRFDAHGQYASATDGGSGAFISFFFDLSTPQGEVTSIETPGGISASVTPYPNGWYRCTWTYYRNSTNPVSSNYGVIIYPEDYKNAATGTGTYFYVWGPQVEEGAFPTSYIPTQGSTRTRSNDDATITGKNFTDFYNQNEGTLYFSGSSDRAENSGFNRLVTISDGSAGRENRIIFYISESANDLRTIITTDDVLQTNLIGPDYTAGEKIALISAQKFNDVGLSFYGDPILKTDSTATLPNNMSIMHIGINESGSDNLLLNGRVSRIIYYPKRLPNSQLIALTE